MLYTTVLDWLGPSRSKHVLNKHQAFKITLILSMPVPAAVCCKERSVDLELSYVLPKT